MKLNAKTFLKKIIMIVLGTFLLFSCCKVKEAPLNELKSNTTGFNTLSEEFLLKIKAGEDTKSIREQLAKATLAELKANLKTDAQRYAFWVNIYNAHIIAILSEHPEYYDNKDDFFTREQITIAGETISFDRIEHGILRKSQWKLGLGYFRKWFPSAFERELMVDQRDFRIHFALNCGAKDCPPVAIYTSNRVDEQFDLGSKAYLTKTTKINSSANAVSVTPLFSWFRGDFGGKSGTKKILRHYGLMETTKGVDLQFKAYDWTLDIDNFIDL